MFTITARDGKARTGVFKTHRKSIETPFFMPVATKGTVKLIASKELPNTGTEAIISNAFILSVRPGLDVIEKLGGIHKMEDFDGVIFTDSGGFQMLQPNIFLSISKRGIHFRNPFDKNRMLITPEDIAKIEERIGADVAMILDDVVHYGKDHDRMAIAVDRTFAWTKRFLAVHSRKKQLVFGITQGGTFEDLRKKSTEQIASLDVDGFALGGLGIGEGAEKMNAMVDLSTEILPEDKPRYLMGVGTPFDLLECIERGIDIFDSRFPTMNARHGRLFTTKGFLDIKKAKHRLNEQPIDQACKCYVCTTHSRAFIRHLLTTAERTGHLYASFHNIYFIQHLVKQIREAIKEGRFSQFKEAFLKEWNQSQ